MKRFPWHAHQTIGLLIALFGAILVCRWIFQIDAITRLIPGSPAMELNAPLLFFAAGICCVLYPPRPQYSARLHTLLRLCGGLLIILPGLHMFQHLSGISLGIDIVRVPVAPTESRPYPGRMSPHAALAFFCIGMALLLMRRKPDDVRYHRAVLIMTMVPMVISFIGLAGYFLRLETLYQITAYNRMPLPTAAGLNLLSCGVWLLQQRLVSHRQLTTREYWQRITRRAIAALGTVAVASGVAGFAVMRDTFENALAQSIALSVTTNAASLNNTLEYRLTWQHATVTNRGLQRSLTALQAQPQDSMARQALQDHLDSLVASGLDGVRLYGRSGQILGVAGGAMLPSEATLSHRLTRAEQTAYLLWQDGYLLHTENQIVVDGETIGIVVAEQRLPDFDNLLRDLQVSNAATNALLCSRSDNTAVCAPSRLNTAVTSFELAGRHNDVSLPIELALLGQSGIMPTHDARNVPVFAAYAPIQELGLGLVITVENTNLYAPLKRQIEFLGAALIILVLFGTIVLRLSVRPLLKQLADSERRVRAITDNVPVLITYIDPEYRYRFCNRTFEEWFGVPARAALNRPMFDVVGPALFEQRRPYLDRALAGERVEFDLTSDTSGIQRHLHNTYIPDIGADDTVAGIYTLSMDVTALKDVQQQLQRMARFDALTGLPNRYQMMEKLVEAIQRCRRSGKPIAVMFLDIDHFKLINDSLGHAGGDEVLREFGRRLKASVRETDTVCRLAGDEFLIIFENIGSPEDATNIARKIIANVDAPADVQGKILHIGTSIGIAYCRGEPSDPEALISQADKMLYEAKQAGRGTFRLLEC